MSIGKRLRMYRKGKGYTQDEVAARLYVTRQTISNWETGRNLPDASFLLKLSALYAVSADDILLNTAYIKGARAMKTNLSDAQIENLSIKHFPDASGMTILSGGLVSQTYAFEADGKQYVMQAGSQLEAYQKEAYTAGAFGGKLPVRIPLLIDTDEQGIAYCISEYIPGKKLFDFGAPAREQIYADLLGVLARIWQTPAPDKAGYGRYGRDGKARFKSWQSFILAVQDRALYDWELLAAKGVDDSVVHRALREIEEHGGAISIESPFLLHGDLGSYNILAQGSCITGIIDWQLALFGDPLYDIANFLFWNEDKLQPFIALLSEKYLTADESRKRVRIYMLRIALEEIYNVVALNGIGYDNDWVMGRTKQILG